MAAVLIILCSLAVLITAVSLTRVGVLLRFEDSNMYFAITIAGRPVSLNRFLGFNKKSKPKKSTGKPRKKPEREKNKIALPPVDKLFDIIIDSLGKLRRRIIINELYVNLTVGGDVFAAAMTCGLLTELVGIILPPLTNVIRIKYSRILIVPAFTEAKSELKLRGKVSIAVGSLLIVVFGAFSQYLKLRKELKNGKASSGRTNGDDHEKNTRDGRRKYHRGRSHTDA